MMHLVLRCCGRSPLADGTIAMISLRGFRWPKPNEDLGFGPGVVVSIDWDPRPEHKSGFYGWLQGKGDSSLADPIWLAGPCVWLLVEVDDEDIVDLDGEVKFSKGKVVFVGGAKEATLYLEAKGQIGPFVCTGIE